MSEALLEMKRITKEFPGVKALDNVYFNLQEGEIHALLGENGAGKSTLIKVLTGVEQRDDGRVSMAGEDIYPKSPYEAQALGISTVYQEVNLCPNLSVAENIYIGREIRKRGGGKGRSGRIDWAATNRKAAELLSRFDLDLDVSRTLDSYSVAVQQMVAIARAVDISAKVLILDEPTSSLTSVEVAKLFDIMRRLKQEGMGIIFVTHFLDQVYEVCDTITVLRNGMHVGTWPADELPRVELVGKMIGKEYTELESGAGKQQAAGKDALYLRLQNAGSADIRGLQLDVRKGEVLGLSGLLGSGRSETARLIFGVDKLEEGSLEVEGKPMRLKGALSAIRGGFAFCPENRKTEGIIGDLSIRENIILALQTKRGMFKAISRAEVERLCDEYIKQLDIKTPSAEQQIKNLSGGNQQKVILARWLATQPELLMLDEPTRGIDVGTKAEIQRIVIQLAQDGMALIFISSEIDEMLRCCGRMAIMRDREKVAELSGEEISEGAIMEYIAGGAQVG